MTADQAVIDANVVCGAYKFVFPRIGPSSIEQRLFSVVSKTQQSEPSWNPVPNHRI
jgi:hypothetical protein